MEKCELALLWPLTAWEGWHRAALPLGVRLVLPLQKENQITQGRKQEATHQAQGSQGLGGGGDWAGKTHRETRLPLTCPLHLAELFMHLMASGTRRWR